MEGFLTDTLPWLLVGLVAVAALLLLRKGRMNPIWVMVLAGICQTIITAIR